MRSTDSSSSSDLPPYTFNHPNADSENIAKAKGKGKTVGEVTGVPELTRMTDNIVTPSVIQFAAGSAKFHFQGCGHLTSAKKVHTLEICKDCIRNSAREANARVHVMHFNQ